MKFIYKFYKLLNKQKNRWNINKIIISHYNILSHKELIFLLKQTINLWKKGIYKIIIREMHKLLKAQNLEL